MMSTDTKERPILYSTDMILAKLAGKKTQTRRLNGLEQINMSPDDWEFVTIVDGIAKFCNKHNRSQEVYVKSRYGQAGDLLWARETWRVGNWYDEEEQFEFEYKATPGKSNYLLVQYNDSDRFNELLEKMMWTCDRIGVESVVKYGGGEDKIFYKWDPDKSPFPWKPSIHMPKEASRIWDIVEDVTLERLHSITDSDAIAEGALNLNPSPKQEWYKGFGIACFRTLWEKINGKDSWNNNPWVFVVKSKVLSTTGKPNEHRQQH